MKRRSTPGGEASKARAREALRSKRRDASATVSLSASFQDAEVARLTRELHEAREQQTATAEVLQAISSFPGDLKPVFSTMVEKAVRICEATFGNIYRWDGENLHLVAANHTPRNFVETRARTGLHPGANDPVGRMIMTKAVVHTGDLAAERDYIERRNPGIIAAVEVGGCPNTSGRPVVERQQTDRFIPPVPPGSSSIYRQTDRDCEVTLPHKPLSPLRTHGCSKNCAREPKLEARGEASNSTNSNNASPTK